MEAKMLGELRCKEEHPRRVVEIHKRWQGLLPVRVRNQMGRLEVRLIYLWELIEGWRVHKEGLVPGVSQQEWWPVNDGNEKLEGQHIGAICDGALNLEFALDCVRLNDVEGVI